MQERPRGRSFFVTCIEHIFSRISSVDLCTAPLVVDTSDGLATVERTWE